MIDEASRIQRRAIDDSEADRLYTRIVDLGSFTRAADDLQLPRATVTLAIQQKKTTDTIRVEFDHIALARRKVEFSK